MGYTLRFLSFCTTVASCAQSMVAELIMEAHTYCISRAEMKKAEIFTYISALHSITLRTWSVLFCGQSSE